MVEAVWRDPFPCDLEVQVMKKIAKCGTELTQWSRMNFGSVRRELVEKKKLLVKVEQAALQSGSNFRVRELKKYINGLLIKENQMWRQRAKSFWLVGGDKNSKFFHSRATQRTRRNRIHGITNSSGRWVQNQDEVESNPVVGVEDLDPLPCIVSDEMNSKLS